MGRLRERGRIDVDLVERDNVFLVVRGRRLDLVEYFREGVCDGDRRRRPCGHRWWRRGRTEKGVAARQSRASHRHVMTALTSSAAEK